MRSPNRKSTLSPRAPSQFSLINKDRSGYAGGQRQSLTQKTGAPAEKGKKASKTDKAEKGGKDKKQADKEIGSRPSSQVNVYENGDSFCLENVTKNKFLTVLLNYFSYICLYVLKLETLKLCYFHVRIF